MPKSYVAAIRHSGRWPAQLGDEVVVVAAAIGMGQLHGLTLVEVAHPRDEEHRLSHRDFQQAGQTRVRVDGADVLQRAHRRAAVLGEMLELGVHATELHRSCGRVAAGLDLRALYTIGGAAARVLAEGAIEAGMPADRVRHLDRSDDAAPVVADGVRAGDVVLVKGSRGIRTDLIADRIAEAFA